MNTLDGLRLRDQKERDLTNENANARFFEKIEICILKSKNEVCVSLLNRLVQDQWDNGASKEPKTPIWTRIVFH